MEDTFTEKTKMLMQLHYNRLSEKDRRQYAALESLKLGRGGITCICNILGIDRGTVIRGREEFTSDTDCMLLPPGRQRKQGGGRKKNATIP